MESAMEGRLPREVACFDAVVARVEEFRESLLVGDPVAEDAAQLANARRRWATSGGTRRTRSRFGRGAPSTILGSVQ
jgi:hypothetical protein